MINSDSFEDENIDVKFNDFDQICVFRILFYGNNEEPTHLTLNIHHNENVEAELFIEDP